MGELTSQNTAAGQGKNQQLIDNINLIDHFLTREILVPADMRKVFEFFSNAQNLELITPKELNFKILSPIPIDMKNGTLITEFDYSEFHLTGRRVFQPGNLNGALWMSN